MNTQEVRCGKCFPPGARCSQSGPLDQQPALQLLRSLIADGREPMLCQHADMRFRVCHETGAA
ncbi:MAG: hypothetical protein ACM3Y9_03045 [Ignavibacteria bacterium]